MKGTPLLKSPPQFQTFCLAHRLEADGHHFEITYGSSFAELYYDFTPEEFLTSADGPELTLQLRRAGAAWAVEALEQLASGSRSYTHGQLLELARASAAAG
jgi:hypothetical protein